MFANKSALLPPKKENGQKLSHLMQNINSASILPARK